VALHVRPATPDRWPDVVAVFGRRGEDPSWCWCRRFLDTEPEPASDHRSALREEITQALVPPGLLAYDGDQPVGWTRVVPRASLPGVIGNRALARVLSEDPGTWWVACFAVDSQHRRSGVGSALLEAAIAFARRHGATALEGHPVDVAALTADRVGGSAAFTGTMSMFSEAGFTEVARTYPSRPVMRLPL
jgi:GNAT superfamily N-acetyltransferase